MDKDAGVVCGRPKNLFLIFDRLLISIEIFAWHPLVSHLKDPTALEILCPLQSSSFCWEHIAFLCMGGQ